MVDAHDGAVVLEVIGVAVVPTAGIESEEGEVREEEFGAVAFAHVEADAEVESAVHVVVAVGGAAPGLSVRDVPR